MKTTYLEKLVIYSLVIILLTSYSNIANAQNIIFQPKKKPFSLSDIQVNSNKDSTFSRRNMKKDINYGIIFISSIAGGFLTGYLVMSVLKEEEDPEGLSVYGNVVQFAGGFAAGFILTFAFLTVYEKDKNSNKYNKVLRFISDLHVQYGKDKYDSNNVLIKFKHHL